MVDMVESWEGSMVAAIFRLYLSFLEEELEIYIVENTQV